MYASGTTEQNLKWLPYSKEFGTNKVTVFINPNVLVSGPDPATGQYSLNHEAGHFVYWTANSTAYFLYQSQMKKEGNDLQGGHRKDDLSGQKAKEYGSVKDIKN